MARPGLFHEVQGSPINYAASFSSNSPRLPKESPRPYSKSLGPDSYDASVGLEHTGSIGWRQNAEVERMNSCFQSEEPRFRDNQTTTGENVGPGKYENIRLPSCADIKDEHHGNYMFQSKVPLTVEKKVVYDNRDTNWSEEADKKKFWSKGGNVWTRNPRSKMGPHINHTGCGPDVVMYEVDSTRAVSKYVPLSRSAGCDKVALPPRAKRPGNSTPRSKFLVDQRISSAPPLDFSFLQLETANDIARAVEELGMKTKKEPEAPTDNINQEQSKKSPSTPQVLNKDKDVGKMAIKKVVKSVRLSNNLIRDTKGLQEALALAVENLEVIAWVDLAFNQLTTICMEDFLPRLQNLSVLNLDSNDIYKLKDINKLAQFPKLTSLTLHSNPVALEPHYRWYVISSLPNLKKLDSSIITPKERERAIMWRSTLKKGQASPNNFVEATPATNSEQATDIGAV